MTDVDISTRTTGIELLDDLASLPTSPDGWQISSVHHMTSQGDPIEHAVILELWLPGDYSFEGEPSDQYTAASARLSPNIEDHDDGSWPLTGFFIDIKIMNHGLIDWSPEPDATIPTTSIGMEACVVDDPTTPFQHSFHADEPHLAEALTTLGALLSFVEQHLERPMGERDPPEIEEDP
jgi:hypothetical protein